MTVSVRLSVRPSVCPSIGPRQQTRCCRSEQVWRLLLWAVCAVLPSRILSQTLGLENFVTVRDSLNVLSVWFYNDERSVWQTSDRYRWT